MYVENYELTTVDNNIIITYEFSDENKLGCENVKLNILKDGFKYNLEFYNEKDEKLLVLTGFNNVDAIVGDKRLILSNIDRGGEVREAALVSSVFVEQKKHNRNIC